MTINNFNQANHLPIILAHDSFIQNGGAERVVRTWHGWFPKAPLLTVVLDKTQKPIYRGWDIRPSWLQKLYNLWPRFKHFLFVLPLAQRSLKVEPGSILLSSSSLFLKALPKPDNGRHIVYCHTPPRFIWSEPEYVIQEVPIFLRPVVNFGLKLLKKWDYQSAQKVDIFLANSREVQARIRKFYERDSEIVYPGIDCQFWHKTKPTGTYFLVAGRLQPHKNNELVVKVCSELGIPLHVVGTGSQEAYLRSIAGPTVGFFGRLDDKGLRDHYSGAKALVYLQYEDFGLMPLEAAACGTPTIGLNKGGSIETIIPGQTGLLIDEVNENKLAAVLKSFSENSFDNNNLLDQARRFSNERFHQHLLKIINKAYENCS